MEERLRQHIERKVSLTDEEFAAALAQFTPVRCRKHQFLIQEGHPVPYMYFVVSGLLRLTFTDQGGKQHILSFAMEDWWECDFEAFFGQTRATMSVDCLEDTVVYRLSLPGYETLCDTLPNMQRFFLITSTRGHMAMQRRLLSLLTVQAKERYEQFARQYPALIQRVPKSLLASYLGVSRETLSRFTSAA